MLMRLVLQVHARIEGTMAAACLIACYGLLTALRIAAPSPGGRVFVMAKHANARRQVTRMTAWIGLDDCRWMRSGPTPAAMRAVMTGAFRQRRVRWLRVLRTLDRRHGFLVACRVADALAWYGRATAILQARRPGAVLVSSDSNPEEVGFTAAARRLSIPRVFVSHAYPTPLTPALDFDLAILEGDAAVRGRLTKGPITGTVILAGIEGESVPLDAERFRRPSPVIGIFTPKAVSWPTLAAIIDDCRRHYAAREIVIRWHPSMLEEPHLHFVLHDRDRVTQTPRTDSLADVAARCDWVIADENSNVHLQVLKLGIPTVAVRHLGIYPDSRADQYGFAAHGLVMPPLQSIRDVQPDAVAAFFAGAWRHRFHQYDASYLQPTGAIAADVRRAVRALFERPEPGGEEAITECPAT